MHEFNRAPVALACVVLIGLTGNRGDALRIMNFVNVANCFANRWETLMLLVCAILTLKKPRGANLGGDFAIV